VGSLVVLLLADSRNTTRTKSGGASTDKLSETTNKLELRPVGLDAHLLDEDVVSLLQVLEGVVLNVGEERGVEGVGLLQWADVGTLEELDLRLLVQVDEDQAEELTKVETGNHLLESLLARTRRLLVDDHVVASAREDLVLVVEGAPLAIDGNLLVGVHLHVG
jgi:hypothetical protein